MTDPLFVLAVLCAIAAAGDWLGHHGPTRRVGSVIIVIALAALLANLRFIPSASGAPPLYGTLISVGAPVSIFLLLLDVHLTALRRAGALMLSAFALGAVGTFAGVAVAFWLTGARSWLGDVAAPMGGMYVATYIGGSANLNAVALNYGVVKQPILFAAANAVDNVITAVWLAALLVLPGIVHRLSKTQPGARVERRAEALPTERPLTLQSFASLVALALGGQWASDLLSTWASRFGLEVPSILILTTLALGIAQVPAMRRLGGANLLGVYGSYLFLAVIGAYCDVSALVQLGHLGAMLLLLVTTAVLIHGVIVFGGGSLLRMPPEVLAVASCANIGGATTVMPIAEGLTRMDLLLPGILAGSLGAALGTYAGFLAVWALGG